MAADGVMAPTMGEEYPTVKALFRVTVLPSSFVTVIFLEPIAAILDITMSAPICVALTEAVDADIPVPEKATAEPSLKAVPLITIDKESP